jgi:hypothetical protein
MSRIKLADMLVALANKIVKNQNLPIHHPYYRAVDRYIPGIGHEFSCGAYSYEGLKSLVEQDGPDGFGATATVKWLIGEEGWVKTEDMDPTELRRTLAVNGIDIDE